MVCSQISFIFILIIILIIIHTSSSSPSLIHTTVHALLFPPTRPRMPYSTLVSACFGLHYEYSNLPDLPHASCELHLHSMYRIVSLEECSCELELSIASCCIALHRFPFHTCTCTCTCAPLPIPNPHPHPHRP